MDALELTVGIGFFGMALAVIWGLVLIGPRMSSRSWIRTPVIAYIELVRNTPLLLQVYVVYFGLPIFGILISGFFCGVIGLASQHGAFLAEIYRGGIEAVSKHQREAGKALGMTQLQSMRLVILPQALIKIAPLMSNQLVLLIKDTAVVSAIGVMELTLAAKVTIERSAATMEVFVLIAILYLILTSSLGLVARGLETWQRKRSSR
ncbi:MAG: amino acid ABC transporter permease [Proteobacteria bacterium]|nr:amino acid ABC transporter permease [Pseudomonadota bacterium]